MKIMLSEQPKQGKEEPEFMRDLIQSSRTAIEDHGRQAEIVDEGDWLHVGLWPPAAKS